MINLEQMTTALKATGMSDALIAQTLKNLASQGGPKKQARECKCGCGGMTKGGIYRPGHDAKHLSATLHALRNLKPEEVVTPEGEIKEQVAA